MKYFIIVFFFSFFSFICKAKVGINTIIPKASLDIKATNSGSPNYNDGILIPRIDNFSIIEAGPDQDGMLVFVTGNGFPSKGFYYWDVNTAIWVPLNKSKHYVGELYGGGIVYYVYDDGEHGLIASLADVDGGVLTPWGLYGVDVNNCESYVDGLSNTTSIINTGGPSTGAAGLCNAYSYGGYSDWYLPSIIELRQMAPALLTINYILENDGNTASIPLDISDVGSTSGFYWSSTEANSSFAKNHSFYYFSTNSSQKWQTNNRTRAIRSF